MKKKLKQAGQQKTDDPKALRVMQQPTESPAEAVAHKSLRPTVQAALSLMEYNKNFGEMSVNTLVDDLAKECGLASDGDMTRAEALLVAPAHTLDAIFHKLARKASHCEYLNQFDANLRLALKAQNQCRATLETLAEIKNPMRGAYVRQANIAAGHQQVNNGSSQTGEASRARETEIRQNKQSGGGNELQSDIGASALASPVDPQMEAMGEIDRATINEG